MRKNYNNSLLKVNYFLNNITFFKMKETYSFQMMAVVAITFFSLWRKILLSFAKENKISRSFIGLLSLSKTSSVSNSTGNLIFELNLENKLIFLMEFGR